MKNPCWFLLKQVYLHISYNQYLNNYEYGNKNTANTRIQPQYDSIIW